MFTTILLSKYSSLQFETHLYCTQAEILLLFYTLPTSSLAFCSGFYGNCIFITDIEYEDGSDDPKDYKFVRWLTKEKVRCYILLFPSIYYQPLMKYIFMVQYDSTLKG